MKLAEAILNRCHTAPNATMVEVMTGESVGRAYTYGEVLQSSLRLLEVLDRQAGSEDKLRVGLVMQNSPEWVAADFALMLGRHTEVPVPLAFSADQAKHLLTGADVCLVDAAGFARMQEWGRSAPTSDAFPTLVHVDIDYLLQETKRIQYAPTESDDDFICKIIHTSGTTSRPKGVRIRKHGLEDLITSLQRRIAPGAFARYLSIVPLSLLIEQVTALYLTFCDGGAVVFMPPEARLLGEGGTTNSTLPWLHSAAPTAMTLPPAMVEMLVRECRVTPHESLEELNVHLFGHTASPFLACGGAPTAQLVLEELASYGITVYEGYGLSENGSVVAANAPGALRLGTVGKPLDHVQVKLAEDGELLVKSSSLFAGYTTTDPSSCSIDSEGWLHTGDIADIDEDGFIRVFGRKKNVLITANGRNVSPEWVESQYKSLDAVQACVIFGDRLEELYGFFVVDGAMHLDAAKDQIRDFGERCLSDVERAEIIVAVPSKPEIFNRFFTVTGRPMRDRIWQFINEHSQFQESVCLAS